MLRLIFNLFSLLPDWVYGKKFAMGLCFSMMIGKMLSRINKLGKFYV